MFPHFPHHPAFKGRPYSCKSSHPMSHVITPVYAICEQQRRRSACTSAQSDQRLCFSCLDSIIPLVSVSEISSLYLASMAAQAGLCLTWSQTPKTAFLVTRLKYNTGVRLSLMRKTVLIFTVHVHWCVLWWMIRPIVALNYLLQTEKSTLMMIHWLWLCFLCAFVGLADSLGFIVVYLCIRFC